MKDSTLNMNKEQIQNEITVAETSKVDWLAYLIAFFMCHEIISLGLNSFVNRFISKGVFWDSLLVYAVLAYFIVRFLLSQRIRFYGKSFFLIICIVIICLISLLLFPDNIQLIPQEDYFLWIVGLLLFILAQQQIRFESIYKSLSHFYWIAILFGFIHFLTFEKIELYGQTWMSDMTAGYAILPAVLFAIDYSFSRIKAIPWASLGLITILLLGSRGPLLIAGIFLIIEVLRYSKTTWKKFLFSLLIVAVIYIVQTNTYLLWLTWLNDLLKSNGLTVASLQKILFYSDRSNGRSEIYTFAVQAINNSPIIGNGIYFDRGFAAYAHNVFLELFVDFGIIIGLLTSLSLIICSYRMLVVSKKNSDNCFTIALILIFCVIGELLFSGSYLREPMFWFLIGLFCNSLNVMSYKGGLAKW